MRPAIRAAIPAAERLEMLSEAATQHLHQNAVDLVRRINQLRRIKSNSDFIRALNGCLLIYYFTYHATPEFLPDEDTGGLSDTWLRDNVADFADLVRRRCARAYHIPLDSLLGWDTFYRDPNTQDQGDVDLDEDE